MLRLAVLKSKNTFNGLVVIPENISRDSIAAHGLCHLYAVPPVFSWNPRGMNFSADHPEWFSIHVESLFA